MRGVVTLAIAASLALAGGAIAADPGWSVQFYYDSFEDKIYPMGYMKEQTDGITFSAASLFIACANGVPSMFFQSGDISFDSTPVEVKFRGPDGALNFQFTAIELPAFGRNRAIIGADAEALISIFSAAPGLVPFQADDKTGNFPSAGFSKVHAVMATECAAL